MGYVFHAKKAAQLVGCLMRVAGKQQVNIMWILKLLYLADRESLRETGRPISGDSHVAMPHGPVLSAIYDLTKTAADFPPPGDDPGADLWRAHFRRAHHDLELVADPGDEKLSPYEEDVIRRVYERYGERSPFALRDLTHELPEWRNNEVGDSSAPISIEDILEAVGREDLVDEARQQAREEAYFDRIFHAQ